MPNETDLNALHFHIQPSADPYCFVEFSSREAAEKALNIMHGRSVLGKV